MIQKPTGFVSRRQPIVDVLAVFFGVGAWIGVNGMFVQLPLLVINAPEGWNLPSYMSIAVQIANLGPIVYAVFRKIFPSGRGDKYWITFLLTLGVMTAIFMAFYYNHTTSIGGEDHSVVFLLLVFLTAIVGCTSSVLFFPYMRHYKEIYLISYLIGEGLSGFLPSILALIQGIGGNPECIETKINGNNTIDWVYKDPRFSTQVFFLINAFISALSLVAFVLLINLRTCKDERVSMVKENMQLNVVVKDEPNFKDVNQYSEADSQVSDTERVSVSRIKSTNLLLLMSVVCAFGNGVFPSIQSYSCLPYGNTAYHLAVTLGSMANPTACFLALFLPRTSNKAISILVLICSLFVGYALATSLLSPTPPLVDSSGGVVLIVITWIAAVGLVSYIKLCISTIFRSQGGSWMFYCGAASQLGSAIGSLIIFFLINYANIFKPSDPCR